MKNKIECSLCGAAAEHYLKFREKNYYRCHHCSGIMMDPAVHLSPEAEKSRYDLHNNDVNDSGYQNFVKPLVEIISGKYSPDSAGLDYGAGPGPVAAFMLREKGFGVELYDPYYWDDPAVLYRKYNYIICSEVIEHFRKPAREFSLLRSLLQPQGLLICMTEIIDDDLNFAQWYYKNDPTHVFFYHQASLRWIQKKFDFAALETRNRIILLET